jgi:hypothetical protein
MHRYQTNFEFMVESRKPLVQDDLLWLNKPGHHVGKFHVLGVVGDRLTLQRLGRKQVGYQLDVFDVALGA